VATPINLAVRREYVLERERALAPQEQTKWIYKPLSSVDRFQLNELFPAELRAVQTMSFSIEVLRRALVGWENFKLGGREVAFRVSQSTGRPTDETLGCVEPADLGELSVAAFDVDSLDEYQRGKS
jgi:hypothetical protein